MPTDMYPTRDGRRMLLMNVYPALKTKALAFFGCNDDPKAIGEVVRKWDAFPLEDAMDRAGLQATVVRSPEEFLAEEQGQHVERCRSSKSRRSRTAPRSRSAIVQRATEGRTRAWPRPCHRRCGLRTGVRHQARMS